jgi:hypothetical protein
MVRLVDGMVQIEPISKTSQKPIDGISTDGNEKFGGGYHIQILLTELQRQCSIDGSKWHSANYVFEHWIELGAT